MAYETVAQLKEEVLAKCQDASFVTDIIVRYLNQAMKDISGRVQLPALESSSTVTTSTTLYYVAMPSNFQRNLYACHSDTNDTWIPVYASLADLERRFATLDSAGRVQGVALQGSNIYYQRCPSMAETLKVYYLKQPTALTSASTPNELPESFSRDLLVNYALKHVFLVKAARDDRFTAFADAYDTAFNQAMDALTLSIGPERKTPTPIVDEMGLEGYLY